MVGFNYRFNEPTKGCAPDCGRPQTNRASALGVFDDVQRGDVLAGARASGGVCCSVGGSPRRSFTLFSVEVLRVTARIRSVRRGDDTAQHDMELENGLSAQ